MKNIFMVGLGGSGGKTLQFLMDQLLVELPNLGWSERRLPACWRFVHVDVPTTSDGVGPGLPPTVPKQGGRYINVATAVDQYPLLDSGVVQRLSSAKQLRHLVGWRPEPTRVNSALDKGAGQYRAVGRLATLARAPRLYQELLKQFQVLQSPQAGLDRATLTRLLKAQRAPDSETLVWVVSSLAGGTGASMTLDVCNLLRGIPDPTFRSDLIAAFLYAPDVFQQLEPAERAGVNANALGTIAELLSARAAQGQAWEPDDWAVYGAGGPPAAPGRGPVAVIPIGAMGGTGNLFGGGEMHPIYRGFARVLASLFLSEAQQVAFEAYVNGNFRSQSLALADNTRTTLEPNGDHLPAGFGGMGFASLGLGRDRYAEYAAQRLARGAVEHLLRGHHDERVRSGAESALDAQERFAAELTPEFLRWAGLPLVRGRQDTRSLEAWVDQLWPRSERRQLAQNRTDEGLAPVVCVPGQRQPAWFAGQLPFVVDEVGQDLTGAARDAARDRGRAWVSATQRRVEIAVLRLVSSRGVPVAAQVLRTVIEALPRWSQAVAELYPPRVRATVVGDVVEGLNRLGAGVQLHGHHPEVEGAGRRLAEHMGLLVDRQAATLTAALMGGLGAQLLEPLRRALDAVQSDLGEAEVERADRASSSAIFTTVLRDWPTAEAGWKRFATGVNEVLLEPVSDYPRTFARQLVDEFRRSAAPGTAMTAEDASRLARGQVVTGFEVTETGAVSALDRVESFVEASGSPTRIARGADWRPRDVAKPDDPTGPAQYDPALNHVQLLEAAREWVRRDGHIMREFTRMGLRDYLSATRGLTRPELEALHSTFAAKFDEALAVAAPLVGVDPVLVKAVHDVDVEISYQFSEAPLPQDLAETLVRDLEGRVSVSAASVDNFTRALSQAGAADFSRIDIISTFAAPYHPIVYSSIQRAIADQWRAAGDASARQKFWTMRRGRPLSELVPVSAAWFQAMITGWVLGRLMGEVVVPKRGSGRSVIEVYSDTDRRLVAFPEHLLGVRELGRDVSGWAVPAAVAESLPLAFALCANDYTLAALKPYVALRDLGEAVGAPGGALIPELQQFILTGTNRIGPGSPISAIAAARTPEERRDAAVAWLRRLRDDVVENLPQGQLDSTGRGPFADITVHNFRDVPRDWEIAPQLARAATALLTELEKPYTEEFDGPPEGDRLIGAEA